jgi:lysophospholipase L1-like esterase
MDSSKKNLLLKWILLAALVVGSAVAFVAWHARQNYEARLRQQIWPEAAPEIRAVAGPVIGKIPTVLLLGDSRMAQWGLPEFQHWRVVNGGWGGLTTAQIAAAAPALLDQFHPAAVVIEAGINDLKFIGLRPELADQIVSLATSNLTAIVTECSRRDCPVIVLATWPAGTPNLARWLIWNRRVAESVTALNARLAGLNSSPKQVRVVDLFAAAGLNFSAGLYLDTLHFTPQTYAQLAPALEKELAALPVVRVVK